MINLVNWLKKGQEEEKVANLRCRCGVHIYRWNWRHLCQECIYCKRRKSK